MRTVISAIEGEYRRYKSLAEGTLDQLSDDELHTAAGEGNSVATLMQHLGSNLKSRFTGFLTSDGEKPWRDREGEFADRQLSREELLRMWEEGWATLFRELAALTDAQLETNVTIRGVPLTVMDALARSMSHAAYHVGQIVLLGRSARGGEWNFLSIPPGGTSAYNANPDKEKG
jgi:uncharacterized damage-inducible protein DinB